MRLVAWRREELISQRIEISPLTHRVADEGRGDYLADGPDRFGRGPRVRRSTAGPGTFATCSSVTARERHELTVYACDSCGARGLREQRCDECRKPMRRVGLGGSCPCCSEPIAVDELLGQDVTA